MKLHAITVMHMEPEIIGMSLGRFMRTHGLKSAPIHRWSVVEHRWPVDYPNFRESAMALTESLRVLPFVKEVITSTPETNQGCHGGMTYALNQLGLLQDDDLILSYDPDSYVLTPGWLEALYQVMAADLSLGYLALMVSPLENDRPYRFETIAGHRVAFHQLTDMFSVCMYRAKVLRKGFLAHSKLYGGIESAMADHTDSLGMRRGYLYDFREKIIPVPIEHPKIYRDWKHDHAAGRFAGNFDEYVKTRSA